MTDEDRETRTLAYHRTLRFQNKALVTEDEAAAIWKDVWDKLGVQ